MRYESFRLKEISSDLHSSMTIVLVLICSVVAIKLYGGGLPWQTRSLLLFIIFLVFVFQVFCIWNSFTEGVFLTKKIVSGQYAKELKEQRRKELRRLHENRPRTIDSWEKHKRGEFKK